MKLFDVYPLYNIEPTKALGAKVWDKNNVEYLDLYGGHGVISIGHTHPEYVKHIERQLEQIGFYSNAVINSLQNQLANKLGESSGLNEFDLFLCNSGAEANENALKLASFHTGKSKVIAFNRAFHGRTSAGVSVTNNPKIQAPLNKHNPVIFIELNDFKTLEQEMKNGDVAAVIIEGIQGVGGLDEGSTEFFQKIRDLCDAHNAVMIADEIQSGYGRTGLFFAFQAHDVLPDIVTTAKGMGNGFPIGGVLISPKFEASFGLLGTTFGGNHLACAAGLAVLEVLESEKLMENVAALSELFHQKAAQIPQVKKIKGRGLMLGLEFDFPVSELRKELIYNQHIFTGGSSNPNLLRILPPLNITKEEMTHFFQALTKALEVN
ncbi:MAG: aspartate aminotransferase family protein [Flavobacteriaceae bacterium]